MLKNKFQNLSNSDKSYFNICALWADELLLFYIYFITLFFLFFHLLLFISQYIALKKTFLVRWIIIDRPYPIEATPLDDYGLGVNSTQTIWCILAILSMI